MEKSRAIELLEYLRQDRNLEGTIYGDALNMAIEALKAQLSKEGATKGATSDLISRTATIDAVNNAFDRETLLAIFVRSIALRAIRDMPSAQPEPAIPVTWIEKYIEQLNCTPGIFAELRASIIEAMLSGWKKGESNE